MKEYMQGTDRRLIELTMKSILWLLPIFLLTDRLYRFEFGNYTVIYNDFEKAINLLISSNSVFALVVFSLLFLFAYYLEKYVLPIIFVRKRKGFSNMDEEMELRIKKMINDDNGDLINFVKRKMKEQSAFGLYAHSFSLPVGLALWGVYLFLDKTIVGISFIVLSVLITYVIVKSVNTIQNEFN